MQFIDGVIVLTLFWSFQICSGIHWGKIHCQMDTEPIVPEGLMPRSEIGRFPWFGVIQHDFVIADKMRHAITGAVLIHPAYLLAPAEDIAKINRETIMNTTRFIAWYDETVKHVIQVYDYVMHDEFDLEQSLATIALVELEPNGETTFGHPTPILSICLPFKGAGTFDNLYVVRMTDATGELLKEVTKVTYVDKEDCDLFYEKSQLDYKLMEPTTYICVVAETEQPACVWDGGTVLVSRKTDSWILLGFGSQGPGCGAPSRFIDVASHMEWIDIQITAIPAERAGEDTGYMLRSLTPRKIVMYKPGEHPRTMEGQCQTSKGTSVLYRDSSEVLITNNYGQGYFFLSLAEQADFSCLIVDLYSNMRSNAAMWVEHDCHRDMSGQSRGQEKKRLQCYKYFRSTAYIEFRFTFSYLATVSVKVYGSRAEEPRLDPWSGLETTLEWWPTDGESHGMRWGLFVPVDAWWYWM